MALYSFVAVVQNIANCLLFIILYIFSIHFAMNLFFCTTCKRKETMEQQPHFACEGAKSKKKIKPSHVRRIQIDYTFCCSI